MSGSKTIDKQVWYGYLEAGSKSSPVVLDPRLDTGNSQTVYLFNLARNEILEYSRAIVEPKLRELKGKEQDSLKELKAAFTAARRGFQPRGGRPLHIPERAAPPGRKETETAAEPEETEVLIGGADEDDSDWDDEDED